MNKTERIIKRDLRRFKAAGFNEKRAGMKEYRVTLMERSSKPGFAYVLARNAQEARLKSAQALKIRRE